MVTHLDGIRAVAPLFVPADRPERFAKAAASGADAIILDLEDAVAPSAKTAARAALNVDFTDRPVFVRINAIGTVWHDDDLAAVELLDVAAIILPKAEAGPTFDRLASRHAIVALIESARGLADARQIAADPRIARLAFGSIDYCADLGCAHTRDALLLPRSELVLASRLGGKPPPIDGVTTVLDDVDLTENDARYAQGLGFGGKLAIHPGQIQPIRRGFRPSDAAVAWARKVLAVVSAGGAIQLDGEMIDKPVIDRARAILDGDGNR